MRRPPGGRHIYEKPGCRKFGSSVFREKILWFRA